MPSKAVVESQSEVLLLSWCEHATQDGTTSKQASSIPASGHEFSLVSFPYSDSVPDGTFGAVDPTREDNYDFLETLFTEVTARFSDHYIHLGGNKVNLACW